MACMEENDVAVGHKMNGRLYRALLKEDADKVIKLCEQLPEHALHILSIHKDTVLHKAIYSKQVKLVIKLLEILPRDIQEKMTRQNDIGNTILHEAATLGEESAVELSRRMLEKAPELLEKTNNRGETAIFRASHYGKTKIYNFLAEEISGYDEARQELFIQRNDKTTILHATVLARHFDLALKIAERFSHIVGERDEDGMTALQLLSCDHGAFKTVRRRGLLKRICSSVLNLSSKVIQDCGSAGGKEALKEMKNYKSLLKLVKLLVEKDTSWVVTSSTIDTNKTKSHKYYSGEALQSSNSPRHKEQGGITPLFLATKFGCIEIVKEILETYPQAVEHIDEKGRTVLHVAVKYRQMQVFKLVSEMEVAMRWLVRRLDNEGNSILHMAGMKRKDYVPDKMRGPALELQDERHWFELVQSHIKAHFIDHRNKEKQTAEALFASSYKDLRNDAREWLKHTAEGCSIVAVLIATVAFAAIYTIPGGPNQNTGFPVLLYQPFFLVFTATDVLSLVFALTSVVIFLSILTSPFRMEDFKQIIPNKLMLGFTFLFLSVALMMIAFAATIILMIRNNERWTRIALYSLSFLPVGIFAVSYVPLYASLSRTYKYLFQSITKVIPCSIRFPGLSNSSSRARLLYIASTMSKSKREEFPSLDAPQTLTVCAE